LWFPPFAWRFRHEEFRNAMTLGRQGMLERVKSAYFSRAVGYTYESEKVQILANGTVVRAPIVEHVPPDTSAAWNLMKNLEPHVWRDKIETQVNNTFSLVDLVALSMEPRAKKAEQAKVIEVQANRAEKEE
jgi:chloramphenicol 3-O-phosphotransferase